MISVTGCQFINKHRKQRHNRKSGDIGTRYIGIKIGIFKHVDVIETQNLNMFGD